ncbi:MAG: hypothetical protein ACO3RV_06975, partial [Luteolibacter sp.]
ASDPLDCGEDRRFRFGIGVRSATKAAILAALKSCHPRIRVIALSVARRPRFEYPRAFYHVMVLGGGSKPGFVAYLYHAPTDGS